MTKKTSTRYQKKGYKIYYKQKRGQFLFNVFTNALNQPYMCKRAIAKEEESGREP
jgi:hypothetical protein